MRKFVLAVVAACFALAAPAIFAQEKNDVSDPVVAKTTASDSSVTTEKKEERATEKKDATAVPAPTQEGSWFELKKAEVSFRVRYIDGVPASQRHSTNLQHRELFEGRIKFDKDARYTLNLRASSGYYFTRSFAETGVGLPWNQDQGWNIFLRQLYFSAKPVKGLEIQYGSMPFALGTLEENITWDTDGYVDGQRITVRRPDKIFFDEATVTFGYVGDLFTPNVLRRLHRLGEVNYRQYLVTKNIGKRGAVTAEYESKNGTLSTDKKTPANVQTIHAGVKLNAKGSRVADRVWVETYRRVDPEPGWGFNFHAEKGFMRDRLVIGYGYTQVDKAWQNLYDVQDWKATPAKSKTLGMAPGGSPSGEKWTRGNHPFFTVNYKLTPEITVFAFANHDYATSFAHGSASQMNAGIAFDLLKTMQKVGWFK